MNADEPRLSLIKYLKYSDSQAWSGMPYALCPRTPMPYALSQIVPHLTEKGYIAVINYFTLTE